MAAAGRVRAGRVRTDRRAGGALLARTRLLGDQGDGAEAGDERRRQDDRVPAPTVSGTRPPADQALRRGHARSAARRPWFPVRRTADHDPRDAAAPGPHDDGPTRGRREGNPVREGLGPASRAECAVSVPDRLHRQGGPLTRGDRAARLRRGRRRIQRDEDGEGDRGLQRGAGGPADRDIRGRWCRDRSRDESGRHRGRHAQPSPQRRAAGYHASCPAGRDPAAALLPDDGKRRRPARRRRAGLRALSRRLGPQGGDPADLNGDPQNPALAPKIVPADFFGAAGKLLGGVLLKDILPLEITDLDSEHALKLRTTKTPTTVVTELGWQPPLHSTDIFDTSLGPATMDLDARIVTDRAQPESSTFEVHGDLRGFALNLFAEKARFIRLEFTRVAFRSEKGRSAEVDVDLSKVEFLGVLKFVQTLQDYVPFGGAGEGPAIELTPGGIAAKLEVPLPSIEVGVFALSNIVFAAGLTIPFDGSPVRARFAFSKREDPFVLQVSFFAGGGFFALGLGADGVELVEAALEAGARASLDIGVASGSIEAMLGVYFAYGKNEDGVMTTVLTGYVRLRGELEIIEIVSMTVEFYLAFSYVEEGSQSKVVGEATVTVTIEVLVFEGDVTMTVRREFAGSSAAGPESMPAAAGAEALPGGAPTFADQLSPADWETWCKAFAAVPT